MVEVCDMNHKDLPLGFAFALAQNPQAMQRFSLMSEAEQHRVLQKAHTVSSKGEMQSLVNHLSAQG